jgi:hypothetical protein
MKDISNDLYFEILKFGKEKLNRHLITKEMLFEHLKENGFELPEGITLWLWSALEGNVFKSISGVTEGFILTPEAYFQMLEHERLEEAREVTRKALILSEKAIVKSTIAIWITGSLALLQVLIMLYQILHR